MLTINNRHISIDHPTYIISEIGINHNGDLATALAMVDESARAGADAVKVQIIFADRSYVPGTESHEIFKKIEFTKDEWKQIASRARELKIDFFSTFTQPDDMAMVDEFQFPAVKISSSNVTNFPLMKAAAATGKPIIMSTGLSYLSEVDDAIRYLEEHGCTQLAVLHCTSLYPTPPSEVNLGALATLQRAFPYPVGFSEHTKGIHISIAAVALGARIIEKHFTLDKTMNGPDHHFSASPEELAQLVHDVRDVERAFGNGYKRPRLGELPERLKLHRVLVATRDMQAGEILDSRAIAGKRSSQSGLGTRWHDLIVGRTLRIGVRKNDPITLNVL
jgi:N,N'-diacetyllegionaminate synthase